MSSWAVGPPWGDGRALRGSPMSPATVRAALRVSPPCVPGPGRAPHSSWLTSAGEPRPCGGFSASRARSCSDSCSLLGIEFFFGRPLGLVGDSRPPPCSTCGAGRGRRKGTARGNRAAPLCAGAVPAARSPGDRALQRDNSGAPGDGGPGARC